MISPQKYFSLIDPLILLHPLQKEIDTCHRQVQEEKPPMQIVGQFLRTLFSTHQLPRRASSSPLMRTRSLTNYSLSHEFTQLLHYCPRYTQCQLIQTVIGICSGVPEAFEVFHCRSSTTEGELSLFIKRAARHSLRSIVLEVNRLPFKLQEVLCIMLHQIREEFLTLCYIYITESHAASSASPGHSGTRGHLK